MWRGLALVVGFGLCVTVVSAQVKQSGTVTSGHGAGWTTDGVVQDSGPATSGFITEFGITRNGGLPFCISTQQHPLITSPYAQLCLSVSDSQAFLSLQGYNEATPGLAFIINGVVYNFPFGGSPTAAFRSIASGTSDTATTADGTISWNSSSTSVKTEALFACGSSTNGNKVTIVDEAGTALTYPIVAVPAGTDKIIKASSFVLSTNNGSATLQCDGSTNNWVSL